MSNCLVAQSGGPTAVINDSLAGVIRANQLNPLYERVFGGLHGIEGACGAAGDDVDAFGFHAQRVFFVGELSEPDVDGSALGLVGPDGGERFAERFVEQSVEQVHGEVQHGVVRKQADPGAFLQIEHAVRYLDGGGKRYDIDRFDLRDSFAACAQQERAAKGKQGVFHR